MVPFLYLQAKQFWLSACRKRPPLRRRHPNNKSSFTTGPHGSDSNLNVLTHRIAYKNPSLGRVFKKATAKNDFFLRKAPTKNRFKYLNNYQKEKNRRQTNFSGETATTFNKLQDGFPGKLLENIENLMRFWCCILRIYTAVSKNEIKIEIVFLSVT